MTDRPVDIVLVRSVGGGTGDGPVMLDGALTCLTAVRQLLVAAARACGPVRRAHYGQANRSLVGRYLARARLGSASGIDGLVVEIQVELDEAVGEARELLPVESGPPFRRLVGLRLVEAVAAAGAAAHRFESTGDVDVFADAVEDGVSADLCDAVSDLLAAGADVEVLLEPSPELPVGPADLVATSTKLHHRHRPAFEAAAARLRTPPPPVEVEVVGRVSELSARAADDRWGTGVVVLEVLGPDPPVRAVRVRVGPGRYDDAIAAHRAHRAITVRGAMARRGAHHWIDAPVSFRTGAPLARPDEQRDDRPPARQLTFDPDVPDPPER